MSDTAASNEPDLAQSPAMQDVSIYITRPRVILDVATIVGLTLGVGLIAAAIMISQSNANFFNIQSVMIVVLGTIFVTTISYSLEEMAMTGRILGKTVFRTIYRPSIVARELMDMAMLAKKKGLLALANTEEELLKHPFLARAAQIVTDGYAPQDVERLLGQEIDMLVDRHRRSAGILRRGAETAPAMGLIGTLVGLVQMLADLDNPAAIGPAMAVALLTTFYGAILGMVILAPLAGKLENNSNDETLVKNLVLTAMVGIAKQENPRRIEMQLNAELPPAERIRYFD